MKYLIGIIIGAIIGYLTNWLAIKMLFRPYNEIKFLGVKIPFTPGLIPKEKKRIAKSVGSAVGEHLLDTNTIMESLCNESVNNSIKNYTANKIKKLTTSNKKVKDVLEDTFGNEYESFINNIKEKSTDLVVKNVLSEEFRCNFSNMVYRNCKESCNLKTSVIADSDLYINIKESLKTYGKDYIKSNDIKVKIKGFITNKVESFASSNKKLFEVVPENITKAIKTYVCQNKYEISDYLNSMLKSERAEIKIKEITNETIAGLSPMIAMFIKGDLIYNKIVSKADELLTKEENVDEIVVLVNEAIDNFMNRNVKEILENIALDTREECIESLVNLIVLQVSPNEIENLMESALEGELLKSKDLFEVFNKFNIDYESLLMSVVSKVVNKVSESEKTTQVINEVINDTIEKIIDKEVASLLVNSTNNRIEKISNLVIEFYNKFMKNNGKEIIDNFKVDRIIEDKINSFDVQFAEKLILEIASKELKAITWLGALLGGLMGILSPILGSI